MLRGIFMSLAIAVAVAIITVVKADCTFNVKDLPKTHRAPMVLKPPNSGTEYSFYQPNAEGEVKLQSGEKISFACTNNADIISPGGQGQPVIETSCGANGKISSVADVKFLSCRSDVLARIVQTQRSCGNGGRQVDVVLDVANKRPEKRGLVKLYSLCFGGNLLIPRYARHAIRGSVKKLKFGERVRFRSGGIVPDLDEAYKNSSLHLTRYLRTSVYTEHNSLTRGHIVPQADFPYSSQQDATFFYENAAPQWGSINDGNWRKIEEGVRKLALTRRSLQVATGTWGVAQLRDVNKILLNVFLRDDNTVPVPALFWKVLYDPKDKQGVAIFTSNNPFISLQLLHPTVPTPCSNSVCRQLMNWLTVRPQIKNIGEVVCCEIKNVNPQLNLQGIMPPEVSGLLTE